MGQAHSRSERRPRGSGQPHPVGEETFEQLRAEYRALLHEEMAMLDDAEVETLAAAVEILDKLIARLSQ